MTYNDTPRKIPFQTSAAKRGKAVFVNLKTRLSLPGVTELLSPCTAHLDQTQYRRMLTAWQTMREYQVFGFVQSGRVVGLLSIKLEEQGVGRILAISILPALQLRGFGRRLLVESFCTLKLQELHAQAREDMAGFYTSLRFQLGEPAALPSGIRVYPGVLTRQALYSAYTHEYSAGAVLFTQRKGKRLFALVTELSGNTGLPKGHVEEGENEEEAALREIYEETGLKAQMVPGFGGEIVYPQGRGMLKHFTYFLAWFSPEQEMQSGPDVEAILLPYEEAMRKLSFSDVRLILRQAELFLTQNEEVPTFLQ